MTIQETIIKDRITLYQKLVERLKLSHVHEYPTGEFNIIYNNFYLFKSLSVYFQDDLTTSETIIINAMGRVIKVEPNFKNCESLDEAEIVYDMFRANLINKLETAIKLYS